MLLLLLQWWKGVREARRPTALPWFCLRLRRSRGAALCRPSRRALARMARASRGDTAPVITTSAAATCSSALTVQSRSPSATAAVAATTTTTLRHSERERQRSQREPSALAALCAARSRKIKLAKTAWTTLVGFRNASWKVAFFFLRMLAESAVRSAFHIYTHTHFFSSLSHSRYRAALSLD